MTKWVSVNMFEISLVCWCLVQGISGSPWIFNCWMRLSLLLSEMSLLLRVLRSGLDFHESNHIVPPNITSCMHNGVVWRLIVNSLVCKHYPETRPWIFPQRLSTEKLMSLINLFQFICLSISGSYKTMMEGSNNWKESTLYVLLCTLTGPSIPDNNPSKPLVVNAIQ
jgi:hypothetical protein